MVNAITERSNVRCPVCGQLNEGVDLDEAEGWVECYKCEAVFMAAPDTQQFCKSESGYSNPLVHTSNA